MVLQIEERLFQDMSRELLANLGYHIIKEEHEIINGNTSAEVKMCVDFNSKNFLLPKYAPTGISFIECESTGKNCTKSIKDLNSSITSANKNPDYLRRVNNQKISGGVILINESGKNLSESMISSCTKSNFFLWDIHRIFFYCMKVFSHSILENWVSQSPLGLVLNEQEIKQQFEPKHYQTTSMTGIRYSERTKTIEVYFTYFVDCLIDPHHLSARDDALHTKNVEHILDDVYERMKKITVDFYPDMEKIVTVEIHSLAGFTEDAEYKVKLYSQHHKNWKELKISRVNVDEHTLFKYSVIPWEAVMDYAFTKKTGIHTQSSAEIPGVLRGIEDRFTKEFEDAIKTSQIVEPFNKATFLKRETEVFAEYPTLLAAHVTKTPIKQRLLIFSRTSLKEPKIDELKKIIKDVKAKSNQYNYDCIGIMAGSGFTHEVLDYVKSFHEQGIGLGLIDAVTKQLIVNKETDEGAHLNQMFLSECIS